MRNIIFRGKRINCNGEWGYGDLRRFGGNTWVFPHDKDAAYDADMVDPKTVGEFTGLMDMNGKGIFEGDIVTYELPDYLGNFFPRIGKIYYQAGYFCVTMEHGPYISLGISYLFEHPESARTVTVIGNIYDNPELLKQEQL